MARRERGFTGADEVIGTELAATAAVVLANATAYWEAFELSEQLSEAMRSRAVIEQAKGRARRSSRRMTPSSCSARPPAGERQAAGHRPAHR
jgi:hypothetical protein